jgi:NitT/TauT family transport system permease protein
MNTPEFGEHVRRIRAHFKREGRDRGVSRSRNIALSVVLFIALVSVWEAGVRILQIPQFILPAPSKVAEALWRGIVTGIYIEHLYYTLVSTVLGFILGSALGFGLGHRRGDVAQVRILSLPLPS